MTAGTLLVLFLIIGKLFVWLGYGKKVMKIKEDRGDTLDGVSIFFGILLFVWLFFGLFFYFLFRGSADSVISLAIAIGCPVIYLLWFIYAKIESAKLLKEARLIEAEKLAKQAQNTVTTVVQVRVLKAAAFSRETEPLVMPDGTKVAQKPVCGILLDLQIENQTESPISGLSGTLNIKESSKTYTYRCNIEKQIPANSADQLQNYELPLSNIDYKIAKSLLSPSNIQRMDISFSTNQIHAQK